jgi:CubicO group peptidase (beta-lactamase class C family)
VGELIRRITGQSLREVVAQHIAAPLGADFGIGATGPCVAELVPPPPAGFDVESLDHDSVVYKTLTGPWIEAQVAATSGWQHAEIGSSNGYASALALARILSVLAGTGEHAGGRLLSAGTVAEVFRPRSAGIDLVLGTPIEYGLGFGLSRPDAFPFLPNGGQCYWGGWGGSLVVIDPRHRMSFAYVMNTMAASLLGSPTSAALAQALYAAF